MASQLKSAWQFIWLDWDGAVRTQKNFVKRCPVVSQAAAAAAYVVGSREFAHDAWSEGLGTLNSMANSVPGLGHIKGLGHYAVGEHVAL